MKLLWYKKMPQIMLQKHVPKLCHKNMSPNYVKIAPKLDKAACLSIKLDFLLIRIQTEPNKQQRNTDLNSNRTKQTTINIDSNSNQTKQTANKYWDGNSVFPKCPP